METKEVRELYLRNLNDEEVEYMGKLMTRFDEKRGTVAAKRALFSYLELEEKNSKLSKKVEDLTRQLQMATGDLLKLAKGVESHFLLELQLDKSKKDLLSKIAAIEGNKKPDRSDKRNMDHNIQEEEDGDRR